jgi:hypothetical protein
MRLLLFLMGCVAALGAATVAHGQQMSYKIQPKGYLMAYEFTWADFYGRPQRLAFTLDRSNLRRAEQESAAFSLEDAMDYAFRKTQKAAQTSVYGVQVDVSHGPDGLRYKGRGPTKQQIQREIDRLERISRDALNEYLAQRHYVLDGDMVETDYTKLARRNFIAMEPLASAVARQTRGQSDRQVMNYLLSFLQSIPYETFEAKEGDRVTNIFNSPLRLLTQNKGDCDDKGLAFGLLVKLLYPNTKVGIVLVPGHAFVAVRVKAQPGDMVLTHNRSSWVVAEPVGPGYLPLGMISDSSQKLLAEGGYEFREIPNRY